MARRAISRRQVQRAEILVVERRERVVQEVESRAPELHVLPPADLEVLVDGEIRLEIGRTMHVRQVPLALRALCRKGKAIAVDELIFLEAFARVAGDCGLQKVVGGAKPIRRADLLTDRGRPN